MFKTLAILLALVAPRALAQCDPSNLVPPDGGQKNDMFGHTVAVSGDVAVVGAPGDDDSGANSGSAYVYERVAGEWTFAAKLTDPAGAKDEYFGAAVDVDGDWIAVGSPQAGPGSDTPGRVVLFRRENGAWVARDSVVSSSPSSHQFGIELDLAGSQLLVASPYEALSEGAAVLFRETGGVWSRVHVFVAPNPEPFTLFGIDVGISGGVVVIGAPGEDRVGTDSGAAYVFEANAGTWSLVADLSPADAAAQHGFGGNVAIDGSKILIASAGHDLLGVGTGSVYVYEHTGGGVAPTGQWFAPDAAPLASFGFALDIDGDRALVTAATDSELGPGAGAAYVFENSAGVWDGGTKVSIHGQEPGEALGWSGALNGDTAVLGSPRDNTRGTHSGTAHAVHESEFGPAFVIPFCFCPTGPCSNSRPKGGCGDSTGSVDGSRLFACGGPSVSIDDLVLHATRIPPNQFGLLFMGADAAAPAPMGDGLRCVGGSLYRFPARSTGAVGTIAEGPGLAAFSVANFPPQAHIAAGRTWHFQCWFRDPAGPCGSGSNVTHGLSVTFTP